MGDTYIKWLSNLSKDDVPIAGGKGANLGEMYNAKFPVPQAFVVTTDAFNFFLNETKIKDEINSILKSIDVDNTEQIRKQAEEIKKIIINAPMPLLLEKEILESYEHFNVDLSGLESSPGALSILKSAREPVFVSVRSSATAEDLAGASFAGQQESFINIKGNNELIEHVKKVFASIFTARSIFYRKKKGFDGLVPIAAIVQKMVNSEKSGVMFSRDPVTGKDTILIESVFGQGEGIVSGKIKPDQQIVTRDLEIISEHNSDKKIAIIRTSGGQTKTVELTPEMSNQKVLKTHEIKSLAEYAMKLEEHYDLPQDIEFAIENNEIYILQTRPITTIKEAEEQQEIDGQVLTQGLAASPGVASGVVKIINTMDDLSKISQGDILVTTMTNPDMVVTMQKAAAIVTSEGGVTAHAAIVSREMGIPAVVGAQDALKVLQDGDQITVDGFNGKVFSGQTENKSVEIEPIVQTRTKIKTLCDLPQFAQRVAKTKANGVGLVRLEGLIASGGKHPLAYEAENKLEQYQQMLFTGLKTIAEQFSGKPIWVRSSDIRSDEYANLEGAPKQTEKNPMLGNHGIRFSLKHDKILRSELRAIKEVAQLGHKMGIMFPQVITAEEVEEAKKVVKGEGLEGIVQFGVMIETPAAAIIIADICKVGIDFISFGTNDLTQYTLAIDRGNQDVQYLYDEMNWAVLKQISRVIRECKKQGVETSICGQAASKEEMVKFLIKQGIDSISVNADKAKEISELVAKLENTEESNTNKENKKEQEIKRETSQEEVQLQKEEPRVEQIEVPKQESKTFEEHKVEHKEESMQVKEEVVTENTAQERDEEKVVEYQSVPKTEQSTEQYQTPKNEAQTESKGLHEEFINSQQSHDEKVFDATAHPIAEPEPVKEKSEKKTEDIFD